MSEIKENSPGDKPKGDLVEQLKYHAVDSTALLFSTHPIFAAFETLCAGMTDDVSINSRLYITALTYAGLGCAVGKGRAFSRKLFNIVDKTKEKIQYLHDSLYMAAINVPLGVGIYLAAGETDPKKIAIGTAIGVAFGATTGPLAGYCIDVGEDLAGIKPCERRTYPEFVKKQRPKVKKGIAAALIAVSISLMSLVYALTPDRAPRPEPVAQKQTIVQTYAGQSNPLEDRVIDAEYRVKE